MTRDELKLWLDEYGITHLGPETPDGAEISTFTLCSNSDALIATIWLKRVRQKNQVPTCLQCVAAMET